VDLDRALGEHGSLVLGYELEKTHARGGVDYDRNVLRLSLVHVF
jgi:hypothetical protein